MDVHTQTDKKKRREKRERNLMTYLKGRDPAHPARVLLLDLAAAVLLYFLTKTHLLFGAYPLGIAAISAITGLSALPALAGGLLGAAGMGQVGYLYAGFLTATLLARAVISRPTKRKRVLPPSPGFFREMPQLRASVACIVAFSASLYQLFVAGLTAETLLFSLSMMIGATAGSLLFSCFFDAGLDWDEVLGKESRKRTRTGSLSLALGALSLGFFSVLSMRGIVFFGLSLAYIFAALATLLAARRLGAMRGCITGLLITLGVSPVYAPSFAILGLLAGLLFEVGPAYALALGIAGGSAWAAYAGGLEGFLSVTPELALAVLVTLPLLRRVGNREQEEEKEKTPSLSSVLDKHAREEREERMGKIAALADAFSELSGAMRLLSDSKDTPELSDYIAVCRAACEGHCGACDKRKVCCGEEASGALSVSMAERLMAGLEPDITCLPEEARGHCSDFSSICRSASLAVAELHRVSQKEGYPPFAAREYELLARLLREASASDGTPALNDPLLAGRIAGALSDRGISRAEVRVLGEGGRTVILALAARALSEEERAEIHGVLEDILSASLAPFSVSEEGDILLLRTTEMPRFALASKQLCRAARGKEISGDTIVIFGRETGPMYALLSDGMGQGRHAAMTSSIVSLFLEKLLSAGCAKGTVLSLLNNLVHAGGEDSSATVDLLEFDLYSGKATFIKSGAAPSYIKRGEKLFRIRSKTVPIGMTPLLDAERIRFDAEPGDLIVMVSDGVAGAEDSPFLTEMLSGEDVSELSLLGERIVASASDRGERDDMSVILLRVEGLFAKKETIPPEEGALSASPATEESAPVECTSRVQDGIPVA